MIALCCHHRCVWSTYCGKEYLVSEETGLSKDDFGLLCGLTSWATCGTGKPRQKETEDKPGSDAKESEIKFECRYERLGLSRERREEIGLKTKRLLDFGRLAYVKDNLSLQNATLYRYCEPSISLENIVLIASRNPVI